MGKKSRFLTMFCKKLAVFCGIFVMAFCLGVGNANAEYCNSSGYKAGPGSYCNALTKYGCPPGCYCTGGGNFTWWAGDVEKGCKERWDKVTSELNGQGVYLCPNGYTSAEGASKKEDCFLNGHSDIKYKPITCDPGTYLPANSKECKPCSGERNYCPGVKDVYPSSTLAQDLKPCPLSQIANADKISCGIACKAGEYLPAKSTQCTICKGVSETAGKVCKGGGITPSDTGPAGLETCDTNMIPNEDQSMCVENAAKCDEGQYLPKGTKECVACPPRKKCVGGKFFVNENEDQGIQTLKETPVPKHILAYGENDEKADLQLQCWFITKPEKYKECVIKGIKKISAGSK